MSSVAAYLLTLILMPIVGLVVFFIMLPLTATAAALGTAGSRAEAFTSQACSAFLMVAAARLVFTGLDVPFTFGPVVLVGLALTTFNAARIAMALQAWRSRLAEAHGLTGDHSGDVLFAATQIDEVAQQLYRKVGYELACMAGSIAGVVVAGWWLIPA